MILARYISKQILLPFILILFVLLLIMVSVKLTELLNDPVFAIAGMKVLLQYMLFKIPGFLYEIMPIAFFLAAFMGIGRMYMEVEMHVLFSCGISKARLFKIALIPTFIIMLLAGFSEHIVRPYTAAQNIELQKKINDVSLFDYVVDQQFTPIGKGGQIMYVESVDRDLKLFKGVFISQLGVNMIKADFANIEKSQTSSANDFLVLTDGILYSNLPGQKGYSETQFKTYRWALEQNKPKASNVLFSLSSLKLFKNKSEKYQKLLVRRVAFPLIFLAFLPWALFLAQTPARKNYYWKVLPLVLIFSVHGSGGSYLHEQVLSEVFPIWMGKWYLDVVLFSVGIFVYFAPDWIKTKKKVRA